MKNKMEGWCSFAEKSEVPQEELKWYQEIVTGDREIEGRSRIQKALGCYWQSLEPSFRVSGTYESG